MKEKPGVQVPCIGWVPISIVPVCLESRFDIRVSLEPEVAAVARTRCITRQLSITIITEQTRLRVYPEPSRHQIMRRLNGVILKTESRA